MPGNIVILDDGANRYRVLTVADRCAHLECIRFERTENLGDGITCDELGERVWVAQYFDYLFRTTE